MNQQNSSRLRARSADRVGQSRYERLVLITFCSIFLLKLLRATPPPPPPRGARRETPSRRANATTRTQSSWERGTPDSSWYRLLTHFYTFVGFVDPVAARHHRRLVRDVVHFREWLFCAASTIVGRLRAAGGGTPGRWGPWI